MALSVERFLQLTRIVGRAREDEAKDQFVYGAYIAWLLGAGGELTFGGYLRRLSLTDAPRMAMTAGADERLKAHAIADARKIVDLDRRRREGR